jgi:A/G-specific adenine glycosylase
VFEELFARWPSAEALSVASVEQVRRVIRPLGLVGRAATLSALAREVVRLGGVPSTVAALVRLPGVGAYAAAATASMAFSRAEPAVDGVSARVYKRYFGLGSALPPSQDRALWELVAEVSPRSSARVWNWAVLDLAAAVCLPKVPRCPSCPLSETCSRAAVSDHVRPGPRSPGPVE